MARNTSIKVSKPEPILSRTVKIDGRRFIQAIAKFAINVVAGRPVEALTEAPAIFASLGLHNTEENIAWLLVIRGFQRAVCDVLVGYFKSGDVTASLVEMDWSKMSSRKITLELEPQFFESPASDAVIAHLQDLFRDWLLGASLPASDVENLVNRLPAHFALGLHNEWRSNASQYETVRTRLISPFLPAAIDELDWSTYRSYLVGSAEEAVFDESFSLRQIFIEARGFSLKVPPKAMNGDGQFLESATEPIADRDHPKFRVFWLYTEMKKWIDQRDSKSPVRLISGGPGSGKSSFSRIMAARLALDDGIKTLLVPLHQLNSELSLVAGIGEYLQLSGHFQRNPLAKMDDGKLTVLLLDGLDELQMQGKAAQEVAQQLVSDLLRTIDNLNTTNCRMLAVVCGRDLSIQATEGRFKGEGEVIRLMPYFVGKDEVSVYEPTEIAAVDQRNDWWRQYGVLTGGSFKGIPKALTHGELGEVTSQPLLNYLVSLSYRRGGITLDSKTNINSVYADLLSAVHERGWARHSHPAIHGVEFGSFVRLLEEVGLSVWHGAGRTATLKEVEEHCQQSKIGALLPSLEAGASTGVSGLLLAFYFRQKGRRPDGDKTFEFTHKSFGEYLTALRIVRAMQRVSSKMREHVQNADEGWEDDDALAHWLMVCGPARVDEYLLAFVRREVVVRGAPLAQLWQEALSDLLTSSLRRGWPIHRFPLLKFPDQQRWIRNAEETLFCVINACALSSRRITRVGWPSVTSLGDLLKRVQGQRRGPVNVPLLGALSYLNMEDQCLDMADLYSATLSHSSLVGAELHFANLSTAECTAVDFTDAMFLGTNLAGAEIKRAKFPQRSTLEDAITLENPRIRLHDGVSPGRKRIEESGIAASLVDRGAIVLGPSSKPKGSGSGRRLAIK